MREDATTMGSAFLLYLRDWKQQLMIRKQLMIRRQIPDIWRTRSFLPTMALASCVQADPGTHAQLPACGWGWEMGGCYCVKSWNWSKLTSICHASLPLEVLIFQYTPEFQNSYIRQFLPVQLSRGEGRFLRLPTPPSSQNPRCLTAFDLLFQVVLRVYFLSAAHS